MQSVQVTPRKNHLLRFTLLALVISTLAVGALVARNLLTQRQVIGEVSAELCQADGKGGWKVIDRLRTQANFPVNSGAGSVATNFTWNGRSENGCQTSIRWGSNGRYEFDLQTGKLDFDVPLQFTVKGKALNVQAHCTTESVDTPLGTLSGQRATVNGDAISVRLVGVGKFTAHKNIFNCAGGGYGRPADAPGNSNEEFAVVLRGTGQAKAAQ